jgi:hypothetical protein
LDPGLDQKVVPNRGNCSNIADNKPHPTVADKLNGEPQVAFTR